MTTDSDRPADLLDRFRVWADAAAPQPGAGPVDPDRADVAMRAVIASDAIEADAEALARHRFSEIGNQVMRDLEALERDRTHPPDGDALTDEAIAEREAAIRERASEALAKLSSADRSRLTRRRAAPPAPITATAARKLPRPEKLLSASGQSGAVLTIGEICLLAGAGGIGKSALAGEIALAVASCSNPSAPRDVGNLLDVHGRRGPVLWAAYEETPGEIGARLDALGEATGQATALSAVHILDMRNWPLYGPGERNGAAGLYSARPERLEGWGAMADAASALTPRLIVLDPTLAAYVGEMNAVAPVREFVGALCDLARSCNAGVLALAHSTKAARGGGKESSDPFNPGQIAGSAAWHDAVRGAMVLDYDDDPEAGPQRRLAISKANMGPARILRSAVPRRQGGGSDGWIIGFQAGGDSWHNPNAPGAYSAKTNDGSGLRGV